MLITDVAYIALKKRAPRLIFYFIGMLASYAIDNIYHVVNILCKTLINSAHTSQFYML